MTSNLRSGRAPLRLVSQVPDPVEAAVAELVAYDPHQAGCRLRIRMPGDDGTNTKGTLSLRGRTTARSRTKTKASKE